MQRCKRSLSPERLATYINISKITYFTLQMVYLMWIKYIEVSNVYSFFIWWRNLKGDLTLRYHRPPTTTSILLPVISISSIMVIQFENLGFCRRLIFYGPSKFSPVIYTPIILQKSFTIIDYVLIISNNLINTFYYQ